MKAPTTIGEDIATAALGNWMFVLCCAANLWMHAWYPALLCVCCISNWALGRAHGVRS